MYVYIYIFARFLKFLLSVTYETVWSKINNFQVLPLRVRVNLE